MKILIATDGSKYSKRAIEKCCEFLSNGEPAEIKIISTYQSLAPMAIEPAVVSTDYYMHIDSDLRQHAENAVADAEKIIEDRFESENLAVEKEIIPGNAKQMIVDEAKEFGADLVVVGSHGYGFIDRLILGSVSNYVLHNAPCSVLVVRSDAKESEE